MGHSDKLIVTLQIRGGEAQPAQILEKDIRVHEPHHQLLPKRYRNRGNPNLGFHTALIGFDPSVLRLAFFRHIQPGQGLYPADDGVMNFFGKLINRVQNAVDPHPHLNFIPFGLNMDITGFLVKGIDKQVVDGIHNVLVIGRELIGRF